MRLSASFSHKASIAGSALARLTIKPSIRATRSFADNSSLCRRRVSVEAAMIISLREENCSTSISLMSPLPSGFRQRRFHERTHPPTSKALSLHCLFNQSRQLPRRDLLIGAARQLRDSLPVDFVKIQANRHPTF